MVAKPGFPIPNEYILWKPEDSSRFFVLESGNGRYVLNVEGEGTPPLDYVTERGPFQNGESVRDMFLRPRTIQLLIRENFGNRNDYWDGRAELLNQIRPNRGLNGTLRRIRTNGTKRDITCTIVQGPNFNARRNDAWDEWSFQEILRFTAFNPVWYDPSVHTFEWSYFPCGQFPYTFPIDLSCESEEGLVYPITFPITFGTGNYLTPQEIDYQGDWEEYPKFHITGPLSMIRIRNLTTDETLFLTYELEVGEYIDIDLTYGVKTIKLNGDANSNLMPYLSTNSDLGSFHLKAKTVNEISVAVYGAGADTVTTMTYYDRYFGI